MAFIRQNLLLLSFSNHNLFRIGILITFPTRQEKVLSIIANRIDIFDYYRFCIGILETFLGKREKSLTIIDNRIDIIFLSFVRLYYFRIKTFLFQNEKKMLTIISIYRIDIFDYRYRGWKQKWTRKHILQNFFVSHQEDTKFFLSFSINN